MTRHRIPAAERKQALVGVARDLFTQKGFDGVSTRELAKAAGVSQTLLYKHFPSKESLYTAIRGACLSAEIREAYEKVLEPEPSTATLIALTRFVISAKLRLEDPGDKGGKKALNLLAIRSLLEGGDFARSMYKDLVSKWHAKFEQSLQAAIEAGDAEAVPYADETAPLFVDALGVGLTLYLQPKKPVVPVRASREEIVERCVRFVLLGVGVKSEVIRRYCKGRERAAAAA